MAFFQKLARLLTFPRLLALLLLLQALFLFLLAVIWNLSGQLRQRRQALVEAQVKQEEEIVTPGMVRGL